MTMFLSVPLLAALSLGDPFADGAVLQRDRPVPVWGTAGAGETVTVTFAGQTKTAVADAAGAWRVTLDALATSSEGRPLVVSSSASTSPNSAIGSAFRRPSSRRRTTTGRSTTGASNPSCSTKPRSRSSPRSRRAG